MNTVNNQPKQLTADESRYLRHQLHGVRDRINQLLDNLDCHAPLSTADSADGLADTAAGGTGHTPAAASASSDPLTAQKYVRDGTTAGSVDAGESSFWRNFVNFECILCWRRVGLPLTSSFLLEYSSEYLNEYSLIPEVL